MEHIDERIIFLILFVVIGAIKWVLEKIRGPQEPHDVSDTLEDMYEDFREEIRQRQTQVQPQETATPPPLPQASSPPVYVPSTPPASAQPGSFKVKKSKLSAEEQAALKRFQNLGSPKRKNRAAIGSVQDLLSNPESARQAIILKEILGEPRSMQQI